MARWLYNGLVSTHRGQGSCPVCYPVSRQCLARSGRLPQACWYATSSCQFLLHVWILFSPLHGWGWPVLPWSCCTWASWSAESETSGSCRGAGSLIPDFSPAHSHRLGGDVITEIYACFNELLPRLSCGWDRGVHGPTETRLAPWQIWWELPVALLGSAVTLLSTAG